MAALQSKIARAIRALIINQGAGTVNDTFCEMTSDDRALPNTTIITGDGSEFVRYTGNFRFSVGVMLRDSAAIEPGEVNPNSSWTAANARFSAVHDALNRVADIAAELTDAGRALAVTDGSDEGDLRADDNEDMEDFTVIHWRLNGMNAPVVSEAGTFWQSSLEFDCVACNDSLG